MGTKKYNKRGNPFKRNNSWCFYYFIPDPNTGKKIQKYKCGFKTKKEALEAKLAIEAQVRNNQYVAPNKITLGEYLQNWLENRRPNLSPTTYDGYKVNIEKHIIPILGHINLQRLTAMDIENFYALKRAEGSMADGKKGRLSERSLLYIHRVLSKALKSAVTKNLISRNVANDVEDKPKIPRYNAKIYGLEEIMMLLECVANTDMEVPIALAAIMGLRRGEILGLKWQDVDFDKGTITINKQLVYTKNGVLEKIPKTDNSQRTIVLPNSILELLQRHKQRQEENKQFFGQEYNKLNLVNCTIDGNYFNPAYFSKKFASILKKHGLPHIRFHDLRHSAATNMILTNDIPAKVVSSILGHSDIRTTLQLYCGVLDNSKAEAARKIDKALSLVAKNIHP